MKNIKIIYYIHLSLKVLYSDYTLTSMPETGPQTHNLIMRRMDIVSVAAGDKTVDGRINGPKIQDIYADDDIRYSAEDGDLSFFVKCRVTDVFDYTDVEAMLRGEGPQAVFPGIRSLQRAVTLYEKNPKFREEEARFGIVAIRLAPLMWSRGVASAAFSSS